jgi:hypothetical protein
MTRTNKPEVNRKAQSKFMAKNPRKTIPLVGNDILLWEQAQTKLGLTGIKAFRELMRRV